jgi:uncharacterized membrane protein YedE/YeeE
LDNFTPLPALLGGVLIGLATSAFLVLEGRIAGITGIVGGLLKPVPGDRSWRYVFVLGLLVGGAVLRLAAPDVFEEPGAQTGTLVAAGLLVGFGTRLGSGCTSGHGVCGNSRLSMRSAVATATFIVAGVVTVFVARHLVGGAA